MGKLADLLIESARQEGFPLAGVLDLALADSAFSSHVHRYDSWLQKGYAGAMDYLVRGRDRRADPKLVLPEAQSILCAAIPYDPRPIESEKAGPEYARYLRNRDYHRDLAERLERSLVAANNAWTALGNPSLRWKVCVDTSAVLEKSWAALAGLGWIGKNTLLIHPKYGSYLFLAEALIDQPTGQDPSPLPDYCGNCDRCQKGCPTQAFTEPRLLDSNRCISYLTLEKRGALPASFGPKSAIGTWIAGCDRCQEVCPFNTKPAKSAPEQSVKDELSTRSLIQDWDELIEETSDQYRNRVNTSALKRIKPEQFSRNLAIALRNAWPKLSTQEKERLRPRVHRRVESESDPVAHQEWRETFASIAEANSK